MVSIRTASRDVVHQWAVARLEESAEPPWAEWRADPAVSKLLWIVGDRVGVLRHGLAPALARFTASGDPVAGLSCVYLLQAAVIVAVDECQDARPKPEASWNAGSTAAGPVENPRR